MFRKFFAAIVLLVGITGCTAEHTPEYYNYKVEGTATLQGNDTVFVVTVLDLATGKYVPDAEVWHISPGKSGRGVATSPAQHRLMQNGHDGYTFTLRRHQHKNGYSEHFIVQVPGESALMHARIEVPTVK